MRLLSPVEDINEILSQTRILLVPSLWGEGAPKIVLEAMRCGIPVLASNVGGLPDTKLGVDYILPVRPIERYEQRLDEHLLPVPVIPEQDIDPWLQALQGLLGNRPVYDRISAASRAAALEYISGLGISRFEEFFEKVRPSTALQLALRDRENQNASELHEDLSPERLELLALLLQEETGAVIDGAGDSLMGQKRGAIPRRSNPETPLSFSQQRLWFLNRLEPGSLVYNILLALRITGNLDIAALKKTFDTIVARHEALRTVWRRGWRTEADREGFPSLGDADPGPLLAERRTRREAEVVRLDSRGSRSAVRFESRSTLPGPNARAQPQRLCTADNDASHRFRRLVDIRTVPRNRNALRGLHPRHSAVVSRPSYSVCGLRSLATRVVK